MKIYVGKNDIRKGKSKLFRAGFCPVAIAVKRQTPEKTVLVTSCKIWFQQPLLIHTGTQSHLVGRGIDSPPCVHDFVKAYDKDLPVKPFSIDLEIPQP